MVRRNRNTRNNPLFTILLLLLISLISYFFFNEDSTVYTEDIPINEELQIYTYSSKGTIKETIQTNIQKKDINKSSYVDIVEAGISVNKASDVIDLINLVGSISQLEMLKNIPRFSNTDLDRIKKNFEVDPNNLLVKKSDINKLSDKEMTFLGISSKERNKISEYRKNNIILNENDLKKLISLNTLQKIAKYIKYM